MITGYCTNVHPARNLAELLDNLRTRVGAVRRLVTSDQPMSCGLWLNASTTAELRSRDNLDRLVEELAANGLVVNSLNGFPQGDFHQPVVKHAVYQPDWSDPARLHHTCELAEVLAQLMGPETLGTISTLPLGWRDQRGFDLRKSPGKNQKVSDSVKALLSWTNFAARLDDRTGKRVRLAIEPEPGCVLDRVTDVVAFFDSWLEPAAKLMRLPVRRYVGVCHDVCHAAVMGERQAETLKSFREHGVPIFKVQVSSALSADFSGRVLPSDDVARALSRFDEPRYLHQTMDGTGRLFEDLGPALASGERTGQWRVHFHVPIHLSDLENGLGTTQAAISEVVAELRSQPEIDWEIETYAWNVLPPQFQPESLTEGIAREVEWFECLCRARLGREQQPGEESGQQDGGQQDGGRKD